MAPPKLECPVHIGLRTDGQSIVKGAPGVPHSIPRIETTIEIRCSKLTLFTCRLIGVELRTEQRAIVSSKLGSSEPMKEYRMCKDPMVYAPPMGQFYQKLLGLDVPILLPLPKSITLSGYFPNWNASTVHYLCVRFTGGTSAHTEFSFEEKFPIPIKMYDTLPLYRQFNEPVVEQRPSADNQVLVDLELPISSLGPSDQFHLRVKIAGNPLHNKRKKNLRLKLVTMQLKEHMQGFDSGLPPKRELKLRSDTRECDGLITADGSTHIFEFPFPFTNDFLRHFSISDATESYTDELTVKFPSATFNKNRNLSKVPEGVPVTHTQGFTTIGRLFSLRYEIIVKVKISHGKDTEVHLPLTVSPFDRLSSEYLLSWIKGECLVARDRFGKDVVNNAAATFKDEEVHMMLQRFCLGPRLYHSNRSDYEALGYSLDTYGRLLVSCIE